ncbi:hypothetical protein DKX38_017945 [Salix brachista]|uniref:Uncharacterized protein n=1 Tax=Salix brachista TaxID=2182728 RepID=A0A5N5KWL7_9ROSI|nr:hypothetical protein DKX38_017945 [Salix brachista]
MGPSRCQSAEPFPVLCFNGVVFVSQGGGNEIYDGIGFPNRLLLEYLLGSIMGMSWAANGLYIGNFMSQKAMQED